MKKLDIPTYNMKTTFLQLELFPETEAERARREVREVKDAVNKMRKGLYGKNSELKKKIDTLQHELDDLKRAICRYQEIYFKQKELF